MTAEMYSKLTFHLLGLAHVPTHRDVSMCAYTQKILKLSKMMMDLGHAVYFYGGEGSDVECTEFVQCISNAERIECYGDYDWRTEFFKHSGSDSANAAFNRAAIEEINKRKNQKDILLATMGNYQKPIADAVGLETVESGIGYEGIFAKYRVFESYAWMHHMYGVTKEANGKAFDCVIPNYFYRSDFPYREIPEDYYLYIGRITKRKGVEIAVETCRKIGAKLVIAGQGSLVNPAEGLNISYENMEYVGSVGPEERAKLLGGAKGVFVPTQYIEPFGGVAVEAQMCGTPVITTDWGAFTETVLHGVTGYRCRTLDDFIWAAKNIYNLKREDCRMWAVNNYDAGRVARMYDEYFHKIMTLWGDGWYTENDNRSELNWLTKNYGGMYASHLWSCKGY